MIRRPLNPRFEQPVLDGIKTTTIREKPWPIGKPIMLFRWQGLPYRSKQADIAPVVVEETRDIIIERWPGGGLGIGLYVPLPDAPQLWETEGFESQEDMTAWFRNAIPENVFAKRMAIMRFRLAHELMKPSQISTH